MTHEIKRLYGGTNENSFIQPTCSCGWVGEKQYAWQDFQLTIVKEHEARHLAEVRDIIKAKGE